MEHIQHKSWDWDYDLVMFMVMHSYMSWFICILYFFGEDPTSELNGNMKRLTALNIEAFNIVLISTCLSSAS